MYKKIWRPTGPKLFGTTRPWTPNRISSLDLWLDFTDAQVITLNGSNVAAIADKSGNAYNAAQATETNQPTIVANILNGKQVAQFDGNDDLTLSGLGLNLLRQVAGYEIVTVIRPLTTGTSKQIFTAQIGTGTSSRATMAFTNTNLFQFGGRRLDADSAATINDGTLSTSTWYIFGGKMDHSDGGGGEGTGTMFRSSLTAAATDTTFLSAGNTSNTASSAIAIGSSGAGGLYFNGYIAHIFVFVPFLTDTERSLLFNWLSQSTAITLS